MISVRVEGEGEAVPRPFLGDAVHGVAGPHEGEGHAVGSVPSADVEIERVDEGGSAVEERRPVGCRPRALACCRPLAVLVPRDDNVLVAVVVRGGQLAARVRASGRPIRRQNDSDREQRQRSYHRQDSDGRPARKVAVRSRALRAAAATSGSSSRLVSSSGRRPAASSASLRSWSSSRPCGTYFSYYIYYIQNKSTPAFAYLHRT